VVLSIVVGSRSVSSLGLVEFVGVGGTETNGGDGHEEGHVLPETESLYKERKKEDVVREKKKN